MSDSVFCYSDLEMEILAPQHELLLVSLQPLWDKTSFSVDLAWLLSKDIFHRAVQEKIEHFDPSPSWLSALDSLECSRILACCAGGSKSKSLHFLEDPSRFLAQDSLMQKVHQDTIDEAWSVYMMYWATQTALLNAQIHTCDAAEAAAYYACEEAHFLALFDFLLQQTITGEVLTTQRLSPNALLPLLYRLSFTLGGNLEHLCCWLLPPVLGLALCRCVSQALDPYLPLMSYHPAVAHMSDEDMQAHDGFAAIAPSAPCPFDGLPPHVSVPSRGYLAARVELAVQLRVHAHYDECYTVLNNVVALACSLPDCSDLPCTLATRALLELAVTQQDHSEKFRKHENEQEVEQALAIDLSCPLPGAPSSSGRDEGAGDASTMALYEHVLSFCESFPRGERQRADVLSMQGSALLGLMRLRGKGSRALADDVCGSGAVSPGQRGRSDSLAARHNLAETERADLKLYLERAKGCKLAALQHPHTHPPGSSPSREQDPASERRESLLLSPVCSHPVSGELWLHQGDVCRVAGDLEGAKASFIQAVEVLSQYCGTASSHKLDPCDSSRSEYVISKLSIGTTRPNVFLAQAFCSLGLVLDELEEVEDAHVCYTNGKQMYQLLFGDGCLSAADISVNKVMHYSQYVITICAHNLYNILLCTLCLPGDAFSEQSQHRYKECAKRTIGSTSYIHDQVGDTHTLLLTQRLDL
jgi:hypothetical protein